MINISNNLGTCHFIDRTRTHFAKYSFFQNYYFAKWRFSHLYLATVCPFRLKQIVSTNEMINILKSLGSSHFIDRMRTHFKKK